MSKDDFALVLKTMIDDATRQRNSIPREGDGVVWVWDRVEILPPNVAELLRHHPWPFGWSVIRDARLEPVEDHP